MFDALPLGWHALYHRFYIWSFVWSFLQRMVYSLHITYFLAASRYTAVEYLLRSSYAGSREYILLFPPRMSLLVVHHTRTLVRFYYQCIHVTQLDLYLEWAVTSYDSSCYRLTRIDVCMSDKHFSRDLKAGSRLPPFKTAIVDNEEACRLTDELEQEDAFQWLDLKLRRAPDLRTYHNYEKWSPSCARWRLQCKACSTLSVPTTSVSDDVQDKGNTRWMHGDTKIPLIVCEREGLWAIGELQGVKRLNYQNTLIHLRKKSRPRCVIIVYCERERSCWCDFRPCYKNYLVVITVKEDGRISTNIYLWLRELVRSRWCWCETCMMHFCGSDEFWSFQCAYMFHGICASCPTSVLRD